MMSFTGVCLTGKDKTTRRTKWQWKDGYLDVWQ